MKKQKGMDSWEEFRAIVISAMRLVEMVEGLTKRVEELEKRIPEDEP